MIGPTRGESGEAEAAGDERAEFYLCLARAFMTPATEEAYRGLTQYLADDLADLAERLGYPVEGALGELRAALSDVPDQLSLLQRYSKLFLSPPALVSLNAGRYLDGALLGASVLAMEQHYRRHGVERAASFHDLPDHVAVQLEFVAYLFAAAHGAADASEAARRETEAYTFLAEFVAAWAPAFSASLAHAARTRGLASPYPALAEVLQSAVAHDTAGRHAPGRAPLPDSHPRIGPAEPAAEQLAEIARLLAAQGHSTEHLDIPLAARDDALGLTRLTPPSIKPKLPR